MGLVSLLQEVHAWTKHGDDEAINARHYNEFIERNPSDDAKHDRASLYTTCDTASSSQLHETTTLSLSSTQDVNLVTISTAASTVKLAIDTSAPGSEYSQIISVFPEHTNAPASSLAMTSQTAASSSDSDASSTGKSSIGLTSSQAIAISVALGVTALVALIALGVFIFWTRRRKVEKSVGAPYYCEKKLPPTPIESATQPARRTNSEIMDEVITAIYDAEEANHPGRRITLFTNISRGFSSHFSRQQEAPAPVSPLTPSDYQPTSPEIMNPPRRQTEWFPHLNTASANAAPQPEQDWQVYPPGQIFDDYRAPSPARTVGTMATESSWRTWNVTQDNVQSQPRTWKERFLT